jgi:ABC-type transport system substrate-binding protein
MRQPNDSIKPRRHLTWVAILVLVGMLAAACSGDDTSDSDTTEAGGDTTTTEAATDTTEGGDSEATTTTEATASDGGGVLLVAAESEPTTLDPRANNTRPDRNVNINVYNSLIEFSLDDFSLQPGVAKSWEFSEDGLTITLELEEGVMFHDGREMTAEDVAHSIIENTDPDIAPRTAAAMSLVTDAVVVDDYTVDIQLSAPDALLPETLVDVYVRPADWEMDSDNLIGTGPFKFVEWARNDKIVLERNEDYWRDGLPYLDRIEFIQVPDDQTRVLRLEAGEVDMVPQPPFTAVEQIEAAGLNVVTPTDDAGLIYDIRFNVREEPWSDVRVRQALNYALDRDAISQALLGLYGNTSNPVSSSNACFSSEAPTYEYDPDRARELLAEAGYPDGVDGGEFMQHYELGIDFEVLSQVIQAQAAEVGIDLQLQNYDVATWVDIYLDPETGWKLGLSNGAARPTVYDLVNHTWGKGRPAAQGHDETMPDFLALLEETRALNPDSDEFCQNIQELQVIAMTELPSIVVGNKPLPVATSDVVVGFKAHPSGFIVAENVSLER